MGTLVEVRGVWCRPEDLERIKLYATMLAEASETVGIIAEQGRAYRVVRKSNVKRKNDRLSSEIDRSSESHGQKD
jgi:hypothetical protein